MQSPSGFDPVRSLDTAVGRRNTVLTRMAEVGFLPEAERAAAAAEVPALRLSSGRERL